MDDLISRQAAIDALNEYFARIGKLKRRGLNNAEKAIRLDTIEAINSLPSAQPEPHYDEWCTDCKEYDKERHCCPRWNRVIRQTLKDAHIEPQWIPCSERLPDDLAEVNVTWVNHEPESYYGFMKDKPMTATAVYYRGKWYWFSCLCTDMLSEYGKNPLDQMDDAVEVVAWMPLPEPYKEEQE